MPKMKTRKAAAKRFSLTGSGKIKRPRAGLGHLLEGRPHKNKKKAGKAALIHPSDVKQTLRMLPNG